MILGIYGEKDSGKTKLMEKLVGHFAKDYRVATVKHIGQSGFSIDRAGTDTMRHAEAGAALVVALSDVETSFLLKEARDIGEIENVVHKLGDFDLILAEGFKSADIPKIMVGKGRKRKNTLMRYEGDFEDLVQMMEGMLSIERVYRKLPHLDCGECGYDCHGLAELIEAGEKGFQDCHYHTERRIRIEVDGEPIPLGRFAADFVSNTLAGMLSSLKKVGEIRDVRIEME